MRAFWLGGLLLAGCGANTPTYFPPMAPLEVGKTMDMTSATGAVVVPFRAPTDAEKSHLAAQSKALGFAVPWLRRDKLALSVQYTVTNLGDKEGSAQLLVNGASELAEYDVSAIAAQLQMVAVNNDAPVVLSLIQPAPLRLPPGQAITGVIREDDFAEAAGDLDAIARWMATPESVLINRSEVNPVGLEKVPPQVVVPALFKVILSFSATTHMRLDFLVRVRDSDDQLRSGSSGTAFAPKPTAYMPPPPVKP